jgi:hypothetical protein
MRQAVSCPNPSDGWLVRLAEQTIRRIVPITLRAARPGPLSHPKRFAALATVAIRCQREGTPRAARAAAKAVQRAKLAHAPQLVAQLAHDAAVDAKSAVEEIAEWRAQVAAAAREAESGEAWSVGVHLVGHLAGKFEIGHAAAGCAAQAAVEAASFIASMTPQAYAALSSDVLDAARWELAMREPHARAKRDEILRLGVQIGVDVW